MNLNQIEIIKSNIKSQLAGKPVSPLFLEGKPGIAKSTTIELLAKQLDMNLLIVSAPTLSVEVLSGLPNEYAEPALDKYTIDHSEAIATKWSIPEIIADANKLSEVKPTILLLDDFHMIQSHLQSYFFKLLLQKSIGNYKLADNVVIIGTMNDSTEAGSKGINSAVRNRMAVLKVDFNFDYWFNGYGKSLNYFVASFLKAKPQHISSDESTESQYCTARSWTALAFELDGHQSDFIVSNAASLSSMYVAQTASQAFATHVNYVSAIDFQSVMDNQVMLDLAQREPQDAIICSYIARFVKSEADGLHLLDMLDFNINSRSFVGFTLAELYDYYKKPETQTEGINLAIKLLLKQPVSALSKLTKKQEDRLEYYTKNSPTHLINIFKDYV